jgi:hypothetical protein
MRSHILIRILAVFTLSFLNVHSVGAASPENLSGKAIRPIKAAVKTTELNATLIHLPGDTNNLQDAINLIPDGGIIELSGGTYPAPSGGFRISNLGKGFTIRSVEGQEAILDGGGSRDIFRLMNTDVSKGKPIIFEGITFQNGRSTDPGVAGGVTMHHAQATFINCTFKNNSANSIGVGGGTLVTLDSTVYFFNTSWLNNSAVNFGGGLAIEDNSKVYINYSQFIGNRTNLPNHSPTAAGGGIHVGNSTLRVSNTRFEDNQAGYVGGGLYAIGTWSAPVTTPRSDVIVANSTFINNRAMPDASVGLSVPSEGGALHVEGQATGRIFNTRFIKNSAMAGGALTNYQAILQIENSVFLGNQAVGTTKGGYGGAISVSSNDSDASNRRVATLNIKNSLIQGRYENVSTVGQGGGGIFVAGDLNRQYGMNNIGQSGSAIDNRATVTIENVVFNDLDVQKSNGSMGGGILVDLVDLTLKNSLIMNSEATGANGGSGGGVAIIDNSIANIDHATLDGNASEAYGGGLFVAGSTINMSNSYLLGNQIRNTNYGSAIFTAPMSDFNLPVTGAIQNCVITKSNYIPIFDDDRSAGPINDVRYNGNIFYSGGTGVVFYKDPISGVGTKTATQLNSLVVTRSNGTSTPKSQVPNSESSASANVGVLLAVPSQVLNSSAAGDLAPITQAYLGYAWSGTSAKLDGNSVSDNGLVSALQGKHTLVVSGNSTSVEINQGATPSASFEVSKLDNTLLTWSLNFGSFLDAAVDQGVNINPAPSGSVTISPNDEKTYHLYILTQEGGVVKTVKTGLPILGVPGSSFVLTQPNMNLQRMVTISNEGGGVLQWNAKSETPSLIQVDTPVGQTTDQAAMVYSVNTTGLSFGDYTGKIMVTDSTGTNKEITINVKVVAKLIPIFLPLTDG